MKRDKANLPTLEKFVEGEQVPIIVDETHILAIVPRGQEKAALKDLPSPEQWQKVVIDFDKWVVNGNTYMTAYVEQAINVLGGVQSAWVTGKDAPLVLQNGSLAALIAPRVEGEQERGEVLPEAPAQPASLPIWKEVDLVYERLCKVYDRVIARGDDAAVEAMGYLRTAKSTLQKAKAIGGL